MVNLRIEKMNISTKIALRDTVPNAILFIPGAIFTSFNGAIYLSIVCSVIVLLFFMTDLFLLKKTRFGRNRVQQEKDKLSL